MIDWLKKSALEPEIDLGGATLPIVLRRHPTAKRLTLRLAPDGSEVRITLPQWARSAEALGIETVEDAIAAVAAAGAEDGVDGRVSNGGIQLVEPALIAAGKVTFRRKDLRRMGDVVTFPKP